MARGVVILENRKYAQITFYCGAELFKASYISKQLFNALYAAFESCVHGALKVATPYCSRIWSPRHKNQPHRRCLPLTGSEGNATMLNPTVRESNYCSHHPHRRLADQGVFLRFSQRWRTEPITYAYTNKEDFYYISFSFCIPKPLYVV